MCVFSNSRRVFRLLKLSHSDCSHYIHHLFIYQFAIGLRAPMMRCTLYLYFVSTVPRNNNIISTDDPYYYFYPYKTMRTTFSSKTNFYKNLFYCTIIGRIQVNT